MPRMASPGGWRPEAAGIPMCPDLVASDAAPARLDKQAVAPGRADGAIARGARRVYPDGMFGFLNVHKPPGPTSHDIVAQVRRLAGRKVKVGHAGTLDPFAEGVLVICVGPATRLASYVQAAPKRYVAEITLGATSTTEDSEGEIAPTPDAAPPSEAAVRTALAGFAGDIQQVPPAHSAVHVNGRRAYKLARAGEDVQLPPRPVTVHEIALVRYAYPLLTIDVRCGSGTYIRSLARDIGAALGAGGYCSKLTRTEVGLFHLDAAKTPDDLDPEADMLPPLIALESLEKVVVDEEGVAKLLLGQSVSLPDNAPCGEVAAVGPDGRLLALASAEPGRLRPSKVFPLPT
jgi:tRNA pseudouridine55 synthase